MQHEIFKLVLRRSEKQVYFPRQGCKNTGDISICKIGDEKLIIPGKYFYRMSCEESAIFFPILAYTFWVVSSVFQIVQILVHSHFDLVSLLVALEATEPVSELVTQMALELINNRLISVQQKR